MTIYWLIISIISSSESSEDLEEEVDLFTSFLSFHIISKIIKCLFKSLFFLFSKLCF